MYKFKVIVFLFLQVLFKANAFTVDVLNITATKCAEQETGCLTMDFDSENTVDQMLTGTFSIPIDLNEHAFVDYESHVWTDNEWKFLFSGTRSLCNSIMESIPYSGFRENVQPNWPEHCNVPAGNYEITDLPITGQYVVLNEIRNVAPVVRHEVKLRHKKEIILCRTVFTESNK